MLPCSGLSSMTEPDRLDTRLAAEGSMHDHEPWQLTGNAAELYERYLVPAITGHRLLLSGCVGTTSIGSLRRRGLDRPRTEDDLPGTTMSRS
jgi:hypothetical protein